MVLNFVKGLLCICWNNHMIFILQFLNMVYHIDWFANIEESCIPGLKPTWSWCMFLLTYCWILFARIFWGFLYLCSLLLEKEMATHSSVLAWRISGTGEPDGLPSMGSHRVRHDWSDLAAAAAGERKMSFLGGSEVKSLPAIVGDTVSITGWGRLPGGENDNPL